MARQKKKIHVVLSKDSRGDWKATASDDATLTTAAHNTRRARHVIQTMIREKHGEVDVDFEVTLPDDVRKRLEQHLSKERQLQELVEAIPASRIAIMEELLRENLTQQEVADLLGISQGHMAVILRREATSSGPVKPATRRTTGR